MSLLQKPDEKPSFEPAGDGSEFWSQVKSFIWETAKVIIISLAIIIPVRYFLIQPFYVKGASMEPNYHDHEYLIIDELSYRLNDPARGDVIVFRYPEDPKQFFIKRIIALPGETVKIEGGKITIINEKHPEGFELNENLYLPATHTQGSDEYTLDYGEYYVLGDNRAASRDSRVFGAVHLSNIIGRAWIRGWPLNKIGVLTDPAY